MVMQTVWGSVKTSCLGSHHGGSSGPVIRDSLMRSITDIDQRGSPEVERTAPNLALEEGVDSLHQEVVKASTL